MRQILLVSLMFIAFISTNVNARDRALTTGFHHIGLSVTDLEKSTLFFTSTLGWELKGKDTSYPATFVSDGNMTIALWRVSNPALATKFDRKNNVGLHHLAISVKSFKALDELYEKVKNNPSVIIEFAPEQAYGGPTKHMMIREPSGNRLEFRFRP